MNASAEELQQIIEEVNKSMGDDPGFRRELEMIVMIAQTGGIKFPPSLQVVKTFYQLSFLASFPMLSLPAKNGLDKIAKGVCGLLHLCLLAEESRKKEQGTARTGEDSAVR